MKDFNQELVLKIETEIQNENQADDHSGDIQLPVLSGSQLADQVRNESGGDAYGDGIGKETVPEQPSSGTV